MTQKELANRFGMTRQGLYYLMQRNNLRYEDYGTRIKGRGRNGFSWFFPNDTYERIQLDLKCGKQISINDINRPSVCPDPVRPSANDINYSLAIKLTEISTQLTEIATLILKAHI